MSLHLTPVIYLLVTQKKKKKSLQDKCSQFYVWIVIPASKSKNSN